MEKLRVFLIGIGIMISVLAIGQDFHLSQFDASPLNLNPALTGAIDGKARILANYRNQWSPLLRGDSYNTYSISYDRRLDLKSGNYIGLGIVGNRDISGELSFGTSQANLSFSFSKMISKTDSTSHSLIGGLQFGIARRSVDLTSARWPHQHDGNGLIDEGIFVDLSDFDSDFLHTDLNFGLAWMSRFGERKTLTFGIAAFHLNQPNISFFVRFGPSEPLSVKVTAHVTGELPLTARLSLMPSFIYLKQGVHSQLNLGTKLNLALVSNSSLAHIQGGLFYRASPHKDGFQDSFIHSDAIIMVLALQFKKFQLGISYDLTVSKLRNTANAMGTVEASIGYLFGGTKK